MNIIDTQFSLKYGALEIYLTGCKQQCPGCHNEELWDNKRGTDYKHWKSTIIETVGLPIVRQIWILGGEPCDQEEEQLIDLLSWLDKPIVLFTSRTSLPPSLHPYVDYAKLGAYDKDNVEPYEEEMLGITLPNKTQYVVKGGKNG